LNARAHRWAERRVAEQLGHPVVPRGDELQLRGDERGDAAYFSSRDT
jgi:hypothetical protein